MKDHAQKQSACCTLSYQPLPRGAIEGDIDANFYNDSTKLDSKGDENSLHAAISLK